MGVTLTWLGQTGFLVEAGGVRALVDPCLSPLDGRAYPPPDVTTFGAGIDWLLITHEHVDHLDPGTVPEIARRSPGLRALAPAPIVAAVRALLPGVEVVAARSGTRVELEGLGAVHVVPAIHGVEVADGYTTGAGPDGAARFVGYVVDAGGVAVYHAGDTIVTDELVRALAGVRVDVALLPVNGRTYHRERRGVVGNMGPRDAVALAVAIGARVLVPTHWDLFPDNSEQPGRVADEAAATGAPVHVLTLTRERPFVLAPV